MIGFKWLQPQTAASISADPLLTTAGQSLVYG